MTQTKPPSPAIIGNFWGWFEQNEARITSLFTPTPDSRIFRETSANVGTLGAGLGWEIGPGLKQESLFVISPNRDAARLRITKAVVEKAPIVEGWEFHAAKPPKNWRHQLETKLGSDVIKLDFTDWKYLLTSYNRGEFYDLALIPDRRYRWSNDILSRCGVLFVEGAIGEELLIERIGKIRVRTSAGARAADLTPCPYLRDHLGELLGSVARR